MKRSQLPQRLIGLANAASPVLLVVTVSLTGCSTRLEETPAYQAACHGPPLRSIEQRQKALEDGYLINHHYGCIDRASFEVHERLQAESRAANTPEAIAQREAEFAAQRERYFAERARQAADEERRAAEPPPDIVLREVDVNTASEADIATVITLDSKVAAQIVEERNKRRFSDWADLVHRVTRLSAAQPAVYASTCGLTVNGQSLEGAQPNPTMAAMLRKRYEQDRQR